LGNFIDPGCSGSFSRKAQSKTDFGLEGQGKTGEQAAGAIVEVNGPHSDSVQGALVLRLDSGKTTPAGAICFQERRKTFGWRLVDSAPGKLACSRRKEGNPSATKHKFKKARIGPAMQDDPRSTPEKPTNVLKKNHVKEGPAV